MLCFFVFILCALLCFGTDFHTVVQTGLELTHSIPAPTWQPITLCNSSLRGSDVLLWSLWALNAHGTQSHMQAKPPYTSNKTVSVGFYPIFKQMKEYN